MSNFSQLVNKFLIKYLFTVCQRLSLACAIVFCLSIPSGAWAGYLGLVNGRSSDPLNLSELSLEAGFVSGDLGAVSYQYAGVRFNAHVSQRVVVFGDFGSSEFGNADGVPFGLGAIYHLDNQRINKNVNIAFKASYHAGDYSLTDLKLNITNTSFELLVSGVAVENVTGYVNFGYHLINIDIGGVSENKQMGFGAGLAIPMGPGELYAGFDFIDEVTLGIGFRYFIQPREPIIQSEDADAVEDEGADPDADADAAADTNEEVGKATDIETETE